MAGPECRGPMRRIAALLICLLCLGASADEDIPKFDDVGPKKIVLGDKLATLDLPMGFGFFGKDGTMKVMKAWGNRTSGEELGLIVPEGDEAYAILLEYEKSGYVKDDEPIEKDKLLEAMKDGTEEQNEERKANGIPAMHVTGWLEEPRYVKELHHVIWAPKASVEGQGDIVNYNMRILGREGVLSVNLMCDADKLPGYKPAGEKLMKATAFNAGKKYEDHQAGDKVAEYGIMGLILGGSAILAKKTGLLALLFILLKKGLVLLVALKKFAILIIVGFIALVKRGLAALTGRRVAEEPTPDSPPSDTHSS